MMMSLPSLKVTVFRNQKSEINPETEDPEVIPITGPPT